MSEIYIRSQNKEAVRRFYQIYGLLQKRYNMHMRSSFDRDGGLIEIWEYRDGMRKRYICRVKEEDDVACYEKAAEELEDYNKERGRCRT